MINMYDLLEVCMTEIENGADLETVLAKYPEHAAELRPMLESSVQARAMAVPLPSDVVVRRNRAKLLQRAAQMREWDEMPGNRFSSFQGRPAAAFIILILILFGMASVVTASADALPGDGLYTVKRWLEQVRLSNAEEGSPHDTLASEIENERIREIRLLFEQGVSANVDFVGVIWSQNGDTWRIASIPVLVTSQTEFPDGPIQIGLAVRVYGVSRGDQIVVANRIEYLVVNSALPGIVPIFEPSATPTFTATESNSGAVTEPPVPTVTATPSPTITPTSTATGSDPGTVNSNIGNNQNSNDVDTDNSGGNSNDDDNTNNSNDDNSNSDDNNNNGG